MRRLGALVRKEFLQFLRRKPLIILIIWTIAVEIAICAYGITYDVAHLPLAVQDLDGSPASRELTARFGQTPYFDDRYRPRSARDLDDLLESGQVAIGLVIPSDFSRQLGQGLPASVQLLLDGSNSNSALIALGYATRIVHAHSHELEVKRLRRVLGDSGSMPVLRNQRRVWYNPALRSLDFEVVSMLTTAVMMIAIMLPAAGLAAEKEAGTIEQLLVMPFRSWELMLAKVVPTLVVSLASLALALWLPWWFEVPIRGSLLLFFTLSALFLMGSLGLGLLLGTLAANLQQALLLSFFTVVPVLVISGGLVPMESMPRVIQVVALLSPLRYYHEIGLGIFLKGVGIEVLWPQVAAMGVLGLAIFGLGVWRFGRQVR
jgi:drug efflux transport system permease protein